MPIREDLVASAAQFLKDPSVASSPIENRIAFLQAKNLTQEEVQAALARAEGQQAPTYPSTIAPPTGAQQYYGSYPPYGWQPPPPEVPRRDWRDWFIMATVVGGVGYGLYALGKRYVYPLVAPPTPERLEQDKKSVDEEYEKAFALVEQLAKDTEALKAAEQERTERLDSALSELETLMGELKSANRRRDDDTDRVRNDVQGLKDLIPKALTSQQEATDNRLREVNAELKSLKTLITQRMNPTATSTSVNNYLRPSNGNATPSATTPSPAPLAATVTDENTNGTNGTNGQTTEEPKPSGYQDYVSSLGRSSPFGTGAPASTASIPAWQRAMATKSAASSSAANGTETSGSAQQEASGSS
ncbi:putative peroxisomal membrane anchor protein [Phaeoacremonium minimum UCRPA7]|uniref:Peroxisomal membrane protein PEX14 n=1 Tax=Phaeoacremonium minimum (strain UCR-PA7) TaxID=1286976 RepID=R8BKE3_PHAM7|nr:putative peroxisomal membrane anchor protein [Phaeoacremonium minimum UCRPA7]EON99808.1 putative peroxisomal membrane anchor protein [Phaeoacremonium minimum UCRPA7]